MSVDLVSVNPSAASPLAPPGRHPLAGLLAWASWRMPLVHAALGVALYAQPFVGWAPKLLLAMALLVRVRRRLRSTPDDAFAQALLPLCRAQCGVAVVPDAAVAATCALISSTQPALVFLGLYNFAGMMASALLAGEHHRSLRRSLRASMQSHCVPAVLVPGPVRGESGGA